jgi:hypothetical protein
MDIRDIIINGQTLKSALNDLTTYVLKTLGSPKYTTQTSHTIFFSYPKYDICFYLSTSTNNLNFAIDSYDRRVRNYLESAGTVYDLNQFKDIVEILMEGENAD